jgi:hypothetical protein
MAEKSFEVLVNNKPAQITIEGSINREELYGKQKLTVEKDGPLEKVVLAQWGEMFLPGELKTHRIDSEGTLAEKAVACDEAGTPLTIHTSSFKEPRELAPAEWKELASFKAKDMMPAKCELAPGLYKTKFCYRDSVDLLDAFLIVKDGGIAFLLTGESTTVPLRGKDETYEFFDQEESEEEGDEMSFGMF